MAKMSAKDKRMADMKRRFQKTSPSKNIGQTISQRLLNDIFGKSKAMGVDSDPKGMMSLKKPKKDKKTSTTKMGKSPGALGGKLPTKKGKVDVGLSEALKKQNKKKTNTKMGKSPGALGGKTTTTTKKKDTKTGKVKATAANTKNYASTLALQNRLIKKGAKIKADGIMGPKTRAAMKKFMTSPNVPKKNGKKVMVDDFKKALVNKTKKTSKTGLGTKVMSTKTPKKYKGTNITPTKLQRDRMRKRMMGST
jgi:hypothetical protein